MSRATPGLTGTSRVLRAELVAAVLEICVAVGDGVQPTDMVVLLESMKMEIPVLADDLGTVAEILVAVGDTVREGDPIAILNPIG